jgi:hypothetical protein
MANRVEDRDSSLARVSNSATYGSGDQPAGARDAGMIGTPIHNKGEHR